jgi:hypothetical protein
MIESITQSSELIFFISKETKLLSISFLSLNLPFLFLSRDYIVSGCQDGVLAIWSLEGMAILVVEF